jgi:Hemolysin coregulated protein Hcp (TssD)
MSFLAKLEIDGEIMTVLEFKCTVEQDTDKSGKPSSDPRGGKIRLVVESTKSTLLFDWAVSHSQLKNGKVTFYRRDATSKMRELEFSNAYCIAYDELFHANSDKPMQIDFLISAQEIAMNGSKMSMNWPIKI